MKRGGVEGSFKKLRFASTQLSELWRKDVSAHKKDGGPLAGATVGVFRFPGTSDSTHFIYFNR